MSSSGAFNFDPTLDPAAMFDEYGFAVIQLMEPKQAAIIEKYARDWLYDLIHKATGKTKNHLPLEKYHRWWEGENVPHNTMLNAKNRHRAPQDELRDILTGPSLRDFMATIGSEKYRIWDEGLGWLAFRFIRPGMNDGYPWSCKAWGPAKTVFSLWVPAIGRTPDVTLHMVPGSHKKTYERHLPENQQFCKDEYRLVTPPLPEEIFSPTLAPGQAIVYHPNALHTEDVECAATTRLNLEFRILPLD